jgi:hypothetical protein
MNIDTNKALHEHSKNMGKFYIHNSRLYVVGAFDFIENRELLLEVNVTKKQNFKNKSNFIVMSLSEEVEAGLLTEEQIITQINDRINFHETEIALLKDMKERTKDEYNRMISRYCNVEINISYVEKYTKNSEFKEKELQRLAKGKRRILKRYHRYYKNKNEYDMIINVIDRYSSGIYNHSQIIYTVENELESCKAMLQTIVGFIKDNMSSKKEQQTCTNAYKID